MKTVFERIADDPIFGPLPPRIISLTFLESDKPLYSYHSGLKSGQKAEHVFTASEGKFKIVLSYSLKKMNEKYLRHILHAYFLALVNAALTKEITKVRFDNQRHLLFAQTLSAISSTFIENVDIIRHIKSLLDQIAAFINSSKGIIYLTYGGKLVLESFGINKKILASNDFSRPFTKSDLASIFTEYRTSLISDITVGNRIIGQLLFINKETRSGIEEFNAFDSLLIETIANQIVISLKKNSYFRKQQEHLNLTKTVINSINSSIIAVDENDEIIIANSKTNELFNHSINLQGISFADIFPKASPLKNYLMANLIKGKQFIPQTLLLSISDPKLIRVIASPLKSSSMKGNVIVFEDVTELSKIKENFSKYVSSDLLDQFSKNNYRTRLGGEVISAAIFFSDIRGFTTLSEHHTAEEIVDTLNQYYNLMISIVYENNGYVDKLVGDEIMAVFKIKEDSESPVVRAVKAAVEMRKRLEFFNQLRIEQELFTLNFGVGINYGEVIIGNIGSFNRMDYTVIGDNVNLASRICAKAEPNQILVSEVVKEMIGNRSETHFVENFYAKGKKQAVRIYEIK